jgi:hypothetical protein
MEYKLRQFDTEGKCGHVLSIKVFGYVMSPHNITAVYQQKVIRKSQHKLNMVVTMLVVLLTVSLLPFHRTTAQFVAEAPLASL